MWTQAPAAGEMGQLRPDVRMQLEDDHLIGACGGHDPDSDSGSFHSARSSTVSDGSCSLCWPQGPTENRRQIQNCCPSTGRCLKLLSSVSRGRPTPELLSMGMSEVRVQVLNTKAGCQDDRVQSHGSDHHAWKPP